MYKNAAVRHNKFGKGTVIKIVEGSNCRFIIVKFKSKEVQFMFPDAFEKHLCFEDEKLQSAVMRELRGEAEPQMPARQIVSTGSGRTSARTSARSSKKSAASRIGVYILNFQGPSTYDDLVWVYNECDKKTNLEELFEGVETGTTCWSVPTYAEIGDTILFMLASSSIDTYHMNGAVNAAAELSDWKIYEFGKAEREKYRKYAGKILCIGSITGFSEEDDPDEEFNQRLIYADIGNLQMLDNPISIKDFRDYININRFWSVTSLKQEQWDKLKALLMSQNPDIKIREKGRQSQ